VEAVEIVMCRADPRVTQVMGIVARAAGRRVAVLVMLAVRRTVQVVRIVTCRVVPRVAQVTGIVACAVARRVAVCDATWVLLAVITALLGVQSPQVRDEIVLVVEANVWDRTAANRRCLLARTNLLRRLSLLGTAKQGSGTGAGVRRTNSRQAMLLDADRRYVAKKESGCKRYFREPVSHRAARLRTGFGAGVFLLTAS
jgi:hypothetical protein